ncbi:type VII secretion protein EccB [Amycolatopsis thailandensis]|uniref:type VII secretion protein EccB n=1 Tax=Amycolatopsis thailandensis TaxID=589330 RepID=UPI0036375042
MKSRKDQVQAYFFVVGRLAAAVTHGKPDVLEAPSKRMVTGTVLGFVLAAVIMGVFGIVGMFAPSKGDSSWRQEGAIVMDEASGARYVYLNGQLRPVLNYASARLVSGQGGALKAVSTAALAGSTVGQPIGIPGAPDSLPTPSSVTSGTWTVCTQPAGNTPVVTLLVGPPAGRQLTDEQGFLVSAPGGKTYLLWRGKRFEIRDRSTIAALGFGTATPAEMPALWLNTIPQGADLTAPVIRGAGEAGPVIEGRQSLVGQIYQVRNSAIDSEQNYVVRKEGLAAISRTGAALLLAAPTTRNAYPDGPIEPVRVGPASLTGVPITASSGLANDLPPSPPEIIAPPSGEQYCVRHESRAEGVSEPVMQVVPDVEVQRASVPVGEHSAGATVDRVGIAAGTGVLARDQPAPGAAGTAVYLITDVGLKFPLANTEAVTTLGYTDQAALPVPARLLDLLPSGPLLSRDSARQAQVVNP